MKGVIWVISSSWPTESIFLEICSGYKHTSWGWPRKDIEHGMSPCQFWPSIGWEECKTPYTASALSWRKPWVPTHGWWLNTQQLPSIAAGESWAGTEDDTLKLGHKWASLTQGTQKKPCHDDPLSPSSSISLINKNTRLNLLRPKPFLPGWKCTTQH